MGVDPGRIEVALQSADLDPFLALPARDHSERPVRVLCVTRLVPDEYSDLVGDWIDRSVGDLAEADLRALKIGQYTDRATGAFRSLPDAAQIPLMVGIVTMTHVEPGDVHARRDHLLDLRHLEFQRGSGVPRHRSSRSFIVLTV